MLCFLISKLSMHAFLDYLHRLLAKSSVITWLVVRVRNQINCVIAYHLGESSEGALNGEYNLLETLAPDCAVFVDVGANVGHWSDHILNHNRAKGILYEPSAKCVEFLQKKFAGKNVRIRNAAVGNLVGKVLFVEDENYGVESAVAQTHQGSAGITYEVPMVTLDEELLKDDISIDYLKIDAEGYDLHVLKGASQLLRAERVRFIQFEYNSHWIAAHSSLHEAIFFLEREMGYRLVLIRSSGLHPLNYDFWGEYYRYSNFLAYRPSDAHLIGPLLRSRI
jgi:FkbM family methyltransferase